MLRDESLDSRVMRLREELDAVARDAARIGALDVSNRIRLAMETLRPTYMRPGDPTLKRRFSNE